MPFKNYEKGFLFRVKSSSCSPDIQFLLFPFSLLFLPVVIALEDDQRLISKFMTQSVV